MPPLLLPPFSVNINVSPYMSPSVTPASYHFPSSLNTCEHWSFSGWNFGKSRAVSSVSEAVRSSHDWPLPQRALLHLPTTKTLQYVPEIGTYHLYFSDFIVACFSCIRLGVSWVGFSKRNRKYISFVCTLPKSCTFLKLVWEPSRSSGKSYQWVENLSCIGPVWFRQVSGSLKKRLPRKSLHLFSRKDSVFPWLSAEKEKLSGTSAYMKVLWCKLAPVDKPYTALLIKLSAWACMRLLSGGLTSLLWVVWEMEWLLQYSLMSTLQH